jgi:hypothetical protein
MMIGRVSIAIGQLIEWIQSANGSKIIGQKEQGNFFKTMLEFIA